MIFVSDSQPRWWERVDIGKLDDETRRSLLQYLKSRVSGRQLLELLGVRSKGTITKYLKYGRRIPDEIILRILQAITEEEFTEIVGARKRLETLGLIDRETGRIDYSLVIEILRLSLSDPYLKKLILEFVSKHLRDDLLKLSPAKLPAIILHWDRDFEKYLTEDKKNPIKDRETLNYYRSIFKRHLEGRELSEKLIREVKNSKLGWLRVVLRHYITYLFIAGKIPEETYAWIILYVPSRKYPREIRVREYSEHDIIYTFKYLRKHHEKYYILYRVLLESGAREEHILEMIKTWNPEEKVFVKPLNRFEKRLFCSESFCRYYLGKLEGRKQQGWVYFSKETCELLNRIAGTYIAMRPISKYARKHGLLYPSDMRKISYQWMNEILNENIVRFIQGRYGELKKQASIAHYSNLLKETDMEYPKYLSLLGKKLRGFIEFDETLINKKPQNYRKM